MPGLTLRQIDRKFTRQKWRVWIETARQVVLGVRCREFTRQKWRVWIETGMFHPPALDPLGIHSPEMAGVD